MNGKGLLYAPPQPELPQILKATSKVPLLRFYKTGPILDQKDSPMCVGYAARACLNAEPIIQDYAADKIYTACKKIDNLKAAGTTVFAAATVLKNLGLADEVYFSYKAERVIEHVLGISPVLASMDWTERMEETDSKGRAKPGGQGTGGHCVLIYGADRESKILYFQNSWGIDWGDKGKFWMKFDDFEIAMGMNPCLAIQERKFS